MTCHRNPTIIYIPPEIWCIIFEKIQNSLSLDEHYCSCNDLYNCSRVCLTFRNILETSKVNWLFVKVIPFISQYLNGPDILNCRLVSKSWLHGIGHHLENEARSFNFSNANKRRLRSTFSTRESISKFLGSIDIKHDRNPFPGRSLSLFHETHSSRANYDQFWNVDIELLLNVFGRSVRFLHLGMNFSYPIGIPRDKLRSCLELTPNVTVLCLQGLSDHDDERIIASFPEMLATLPFLNTLIFESRGCSRHRICTKIPAIVQCSIASQYGHQLNQLDINFAEGHFRSSFGKYSMSALSSLEDLNITVDSAAQLFIIFPIGTIHSNKLNVVNIRIVHFNMPSNLFDMIEANKSISLGSLLRPLVQFGECLQELAIITEDNTLKLKAVLEKDLDLLDQFKCVRRLNFEGFWFGLTSILGHLPPSIECLHLTGIKQYDNNHHEINYISIDIPDQDAIFCSNAFSRLPKLKMLKVRDYDSQFVDVYRRKDKFYWQGRTQKSQRPIVTGNTDYCCRLWLFFLSVLMPYFVVWLIMSKKA